MKMFAKASSFKSLMTAGLVSMLMAACHGAGYHPGDGSTSNPGGSITNPSITAAAYANAPLTTFLASAPITISLPATLTTSVVVTPDSPSGNAYVADCSMTVMHYQDQFSNGALTLTPSGGKVVFCIGSVSPASSGTTVNVVADAAYTYTTTTTTVSTGGSTSGGTTGGTSGGTSGGSTTTLVNNKVDDFASFPITTGTANGVVNVSNLYLALAMIALDPKDAVLNSGVYRVNGSPNAGSSTCLNSGTETTAPTTGQKANPTITTLTNCETTTASTDFYNPGVAIGTLSVPASGTPLPVTETGTYTNDSDAAASNYFSEHSSSTGNATTPPNYVLTYNDANGNAIAYRQGTASEKFISDTQDTVNGYFFTLQKTGTLSSTLTTTPTNSQTIQISSSGFISSGANPQYSNGGLIASFDDAGMIGVSSTINFVNPWPETCLANNAEYVVSTLNPGHTSYQSALVTSTSTDPLNEGDIAAGSDDFIRFHKNPSNNPGSSPSTLPGSTSIMNGTVFIYDHTGTNKLATLVFGQNPASTSDTDKLTTGFSVSITGLDGSTAVIHSADLGNIPSFSRICDDNGETFAGTNPANLFSQSILNQVSRILHSQDIPVSD